MYEEQEDFSEKGEAEEQPNADALDKDRDTFEVDVTEDYKYDENLYESKDYEYVPEDEKEEWEMVEEQLSGTYWEKEAKKKVHIELETPVERRRTIYELDSYASSGPSMSDILKLSSMDPTVQTAEPPKQIRYSVSMGAPGIARINLSPLTQKIIGCVIGENVTTEYPWVYVKKEIIEDNIDLHDESSDFLPMKDEIQTFPDTKMLIGYAPSLTDEAQFYICLTEEGRDTIIKHIQMQREEHENRVRTAIYKPLGEWHDLGSSKEIDDCIIKKTRPLLEIEVVATADLLNAPMNLTDRKADQQRDGYIELLPYRQTFENVIRKLIGRRTQVSPSVQESEAQTTLSMPANSSFQYKYKYSPVDLSTYNEEQIESLKNFLHRYTEEICDQILLNATWDIYANDYQNLVRNEKDTQPPVLTGYREHQSFHDGKRIIDKVINDLSWHPFWTGISFAAYTQYAKSHHLVGPKAYDKVLKACEGDNYVLVWSFNDSLTPKLVLECPREVTAVASCPLDGSVIVGGCANGQIAIWHIPGIIERIEAIGLQSTTHVKYRIAIRTLTMWMREAIGSSIVRPAAMSSFKESQKAAITQIIWMSSHFKVNQDGQITSLPEETAPDDLNWQFVTASEDGTIAFWDLKWRPSGAEARKASRKKGQIKQPDALLQSISPYKILDRVFKPDYILVVQYPNESRRQVITTISMYNPKFRKEQVEPFPLSKDITVRRYFKSIIEKPMIMLKPRILVGTVEGDFGCITWDGYDFATDVAVNRELCQWTWMKRVHDGPVTHTVRSKYYSDIIATVGGTVFAVWKDDFGEPLISKKSSIGYTACSWGSFRPTILILARMDGTIEIWDFIVKSQEPCFTQSLSGRIITGIYTHELYLDPQCVGFCDFNGILRMFLAPGVFLRYDKTDIDWMRRFVDRQAERISEFQSWQKRWNETNHETIEKKKKQAEMEAEQKQQETEEKLKKEIAERTAKLDASKKTITTQSPWTFIEAARERWKSMELRRMQRVILEKKGLRKDDLERQRAPILKLRQDARRKKRKIREILQLQDKIFEETVAFLFPEQYQERKAPSLPPLAPSKAANRLVASSIADNAILQKETQDYFIDPNEEIIYNFMEVQSEALASLQSRPFERSFDWRKVLAEGKSRRSSMDVGLRRANEPKRKFTKSEEIKLLG